VEFEMGMGYNLAATGVPGASAGTRVHPELRNWDGSKSVPQRAD